MARNESVDTLCGTGERVFRHLSNSVKLVFKTDGSVSGTGWVVNWQGKLRSLILC